MDFLANMLGLMSEEVTFLVDRTTLFLTTVFNVNFWLVRTFLEAMSSVGRAAAVVGIGVERCLEDFATFVLDLVAICLGFLHAVEACLMAILWGIRSGVQWTGQLLVTTGQGLSSGACWLASLGHLLGMALALLLKTAMEVLGLIPWSLRNVAWSVMNLAASVVETLNRSRAALSRTFQWSLMALLSGSRDSYMGLVILALAVYLGKRFHVLERVRTAMMMSPALVKLVVLVLATTVKNVGSWLTKRIKSLGSGMTVLIKSIGCLLTRAAAPTDEEETEEETEDAAAGLDQAVGPEHVPVTKRVLRSASRKGNGPSSECGDEDAAVLRLRKQVERLQEMNLCVVCQEAGRTVTLLPCRHLCLCEPCTRRVLTAKPVCPMCRKHVDDVLQVYT